jgi:hypothetical protein
LSFAAQNSWNLCTLLQNSFHGILKQGLILVVFHSIIAQQKKEAVSCIMQKTASVTA